MPLGISNNCRNIAPSATLAMDAKAKAMRAAGVDVVGFAAGEPDFDTPEVVREAMKDALDRGMTRYTAAAGTPEVRDAIAKRLEMDHGLHYEQNQIIVTSGAKHALYTAFQSLCSEEDEVIIPTPCWVSYPEMVRMAGGKSVLVECSEENGFLPAMEDIEKVVTEKTKAFVLTNPSNPNGCIWDEERLRALVQLAVDKQFYIIADEIYEKLVYGAAKHVAVATLSPEAYTHTILISGVSKSYAMTGLRIGFAAGPVDVIAGMVNYQSQSTSAPNSAAQHAAAVAYTMDQSCVEEMRQQFEKRRNYIVQRINAIPGVSCRMPDGAFYVMMNMKQLVGKRYGEQTIGNSNDLALMLLEHAHVALVPGNAFLAEGFCRLSYATSMENIEKGMDRIEAFVKELS
ncbi:MAG: pyridoxal phosphate-dependent aminotransferase [Clostridia bacterium]|nr:pyridoxal phosphate-dependent aminotransferase [Clostridia bacterium]MBP3650250.1 pyridoxal phosphate-dependent aminotransferase [Clostridia bacterium]